MINNILLCTDVYKMGHMEQYHPDVTKVYSYLEARKPNNNIVNFGLQYFLKEYLMKAITVENVEEFCDIYNCILGNVPNTTYDKLNKLQKLGYIPLQIKQVAEGTVIPSGNIMMSITNTHPDFPWVVGFFESLLLKVWNTCTVATYSKKLKSLMEFYGNITCDNNSHIPFAVHDFGYRGVSSEETAILSGMAHLVNFLGTDTVLGVWGAKKYYDAEEPIGLSVPASEHSVMCSFGPENEFQAFEHMLNVYPTGIVSIVADTYNLWNVLDNFLPRLKERILNRNGKVVIRPDSGVQEEIIPECLKKLNNVFGAEINSKGYSVLNPKVGLIYGDGFYYDRFVRVFDIMKNLKWASSNLVVGVGGLLLQQHSRDEYGFALKATYVEKNGKPVNIFKDPITDPGKKSKTGLMRLDKLASHGGYYYSTLDKCSWADESKGLLKTAYANSTLVSPIKFSQVRYNSY